MCDLGAYAPASNSLPCIQTALSRAQADFRDTANAAHDAKKALDLAESTLPRPMGNATIRLFYRQRLNEQHRMANIVMSLDGMRRQAIRSARAE